MMLFSITLTAPQEGLLLLKLPAVSKRGQQIHDPAWKAVHPLPGAPIAGQHLGFHPMAGVWAMFWDVTALAGQEGPQEQQPAATQVHCHRLGSGGTGRAKVRGGPRCGAAPHSGPCVL